MDQKIKYPNINVDSSILFNNENKKNNNEQVEDIYTAVQEEVSLSEDDGSCYEDNSFFSMLNTIEDFSDRFNEAKAKFVSGIIGIFNEEKAQEYYDKEISKVEKDTTGAIYAEYIISELNDGSEFNNWFTEIIERSNYIFSFFKELEMPNLYGDKYAKLAEEYYGEGISAVDAETHWCLIFVNKMLKDSNYDLKGYDETAISCTAEVKHILKENPDAFHFSPAKYNGVTSLDYKPKAGDIFFLEDTYENIQDGWLVCHTGIVVDVKEKDGKIYEINTIEGNVDGDDTGSDARYYNSSKVNYKKYVLTEDGQYCLVDNDSETLDEPTKINKDRVIYGFFDTNGNVIK